MIESETGVPCESAVADGVEVREEIACGELVAIALQAAEASRQLLERLVAELPAASVVRTLAAEAGWMAAQASTALRAAASGAANPGLARVSAGFEVAHVARHAATSQEAEAARARALAEGETVDARAAAECGSARAPGTLSAELSCSVEDVRALGYRSSPSVEGAIAVAAAADAEA